MRKVLTLTILFFIIASLFCNSFALSIGTTEVVCSHWCDSYMTYQGNIKRAVYAVYSNGMPAYCITPDFEGVGSGGRNSYEVIATSNLQNENAWKAIINGYPYKSCAELGAANENEAYYATKYAVYTMLNPNENPLDYRPIDDSDSAIRVHQIYLNIVNAARGSDEILTNNSNISIVSDNNWSVDDINKEYLSKTYSVNYLVKNGTYIVNIEGTLPEGSMITNINNEVQTQFNIKDKFKILIPIKNAISSEKFNIKVVSNLETKPVLYGKSTIPNTQDYALTGFVMEDSSTSIQDEYIKNTTKIKIIKREFGSEITLTGVKFNVLDENKNIVFEDLITDENGEILLENLIPGKYFIEETETLEGYNKYDELIEVDVNLNEEINVLVNNSLKKYRSIEKESETVEVISNYEETKYNSQNISKIIDQENVTEKQEVKKLPVTGF